MPQVPEMARRDLAGALLQLKALGVDSLAEFDFPAPPPPQLAAKAVEALHILKALDSEARCHVQWKCMLKSLPHLPFPLENSCLLLRKQEPSNCTSCDT